MRLPTPEEIAERSVGVAAATEIRVRFQQDVLSVRISGGEVERYLRDSFSFMLAPDDTPADSGWRDTTLDLVGEHPVRSELRQFIHNAVFREFVALRPDLMWIHAGVVEKNGIATIIAGASGQGKSTLTTMLCDAGFSYMSDDVAPIDTGADTVYAFPQTPRRRVPAARDLAPDEVQQLERNVVAITSETVRHDPAPIGSLVFLDYRSGAHPTLTKLNAGETALGIIGTLTNFQDHRSAAVARSAALAQSVPAFRLTFGHPADRAAEIISAI